ncbi:hypothetical protein BV898_18718 [Hypsibius exemplaris]|uniref:CUB domain-containing protein n=1 Tax=Hypsibius exemplaris TaxID=2072580 RepID=A0A9X6NI22_HYPEX|nr:hypothetical protein BV898_18718 [Hypsibius exemplaris]
MLLPLLVTGLTVITTGSFAASETLCDCGETTLHIPNGSVKVIHSPNFTWNRSTLGKASMNNLGPYAANCSCLYQVTGPKGSQIGIKIDELVLRQMYWAGGRECLDDIRFFDVIRGCKVPFGPPRSCSKNKISSGGQLISQSNSIIIEFNCAAFDGGFEEGMFYGYKIAAHAIAAAVIPDCGGDVQVPDGGVVTFQSPYFPKSYPHGLQCEYHIRSSSGTVIQFTSQFFDVSADFGCFGDSLTFYEMFKGVQVMLSDSPLCGNKFEKLISNNNFVLAKFVANSVNFNRTEGGFRISARARDPSKVFPECECPSS